MAAGMGHNLTKEVGAGQKLYPQLPKNGEEGMGSTTDIRLGFEEPGESTDRILVSNLPQGVSEDHLRLFFGKKKNFNVTKVIGVDLDSNSNTAVIIFNESEDVERVLNKTPVVIKEKAVKVDRYIVKVDEPKDLYDKCTIEVTGVNEVTDVETLQMYFESEEASGAEIDGVEVKFLPDDKMFLIKLDSEEVVDAILKRTHQLDGSELNVRKHIPPLPEATYPNQVFVGGFKKETGEDLMINFLEGRTKKDVEKVIYGELDGTAIVVFKQQPDIDELKKECRNRRLGDINLEIDSVPVSKCIIVSNIKPGTKKEAIEYYFDNELRSGVNGVLNVEMDEENNTCVVHFVDTEAPVKACQRSHDIEGKTVKTEIYQICLGGTASADGPRFKPLDPLQLDLEKNIAYFLSFPGPFREELNKNLKVCHGEVLKWPDTSSQVISINCLLTADNPNCKKLAKTWESDVKQCVSKTQKNVVVKDLKLLQDAWKPVMDEVRKISISDPERVVLRAELNEHTLHIIGYQKQVNNLYDQIKKIFDQKMAQIEQKKQQVKETLPLKPFQVEMLIQRDFNGKDLKSLKNLQVLIDAVKGEITFEGLSKEVTEAKMKMYEAVLNKICSVPHKMSTYQQNYAKRPEVSVKVKTALGNKKKVCFWEIKDSGIVMYAMSDKEAVECLDIFREFVNETDFHVQKSSDAVFKSKLWRDEVDRIKRKYTACYVDIVYERGKIIILSTDSKQFGELREEVQDFLEKNIVKRQEYKLTTSQMKVIESQLRQKLKDIEKGLEKEKVKVEITSNVIVVEGNEAGMRAAMSKVDDIINAIDTRVLTIKRPGIGRYMMTEGRNKVETIEKDLGVIIDSDILNKEGSFESNPKSRDGHSRERGNVKSLNPKAVVEVATASMPPQGRQLIAVLGDITLLDVDVIVNAANNDMDHKGGLAKVIASKGGRSIQDECTKHVQQNGSLSEGEVYFSQPGRLKCKMICHAVGPTWKGGAKNEEDHLRNCVLMALGGCDEKSYTSIAFPAISTGIFGYPVDKATNTILEAVKDYFKELHKSNIKKVFLCDVVDKTVQWFVTGMKTNFQCQVLANMDHFQKWRPDIQQTSPREAGRGRPSSGRPSSARPSSARPGTAQGRKHSVKMGKIDVKIYQGDITMANVDMVVFSSNTQCDLRRGAVAQTIMKKGGNDIITEVNKLTDDMKRNGLVVTTGGKLPCRKLIHLDMQETSRDLKTKVFQVLKKSDDLNMKTMALPALGTANANMDVNNVARDILGVISTFQPLQLQEVHIIIYQGTMVKAFIDAADKVRPGIAREPSRFMDTPAKQMEFGTMVKAFIDAADKVRPGIAREPSRFMDTPAKQMEFGPNSKARENREWKKAASERPVSEVKVTITGKDKATVDKAITTLNKHVDDAMVTKEIEAGKVVKELKKEQHEELKNIGLSEGVEITTDPNNGKVILKGFSPNLASAMDRANSMITDAEQGRLDGLKANIMKESVQWYTIQKRKGKDVLIEYPVGINMNLETKYQNMENQAKITDTKGNKFIVDFTAMEEYADGNRNDCVSVLRKSKLMEKDQDLPKIWDLMGEEESVRIVPLQQSSTEYQEIQKKFLSSVGGKRNIVEIHRIQNKTLCQQYMAKKKAIEGINPKGHQNERMLWHGFAKDAMDSINKFGFNRSYCGKNATAYGDGVYFATNASYSVQDRYSVPDSNGHKRIYLAQVLTGEYTNGGYGMRYPPAKPLPGGGQSHILYDSVVDSVSSPSMYIIFHDAQAYPQYMITFT